MREGGRNCALGLTQLVIGLRNEVINGSGITLWMDEE